jgi:energy-coupling factor transporter ATP-binding protein EcfA2
MTDAWRTVRTETAAVYDDANRIDAAAFRPWEQLATEECPLPTVSPPGLRFGQLELSLERLPGGVSSRPEFNAFGPVAWTQPATVPFPVEASLLIKTTGDQKEVASEMMQALMLRIASGVPAGQTRFTIIDPLGLGKQYAGFMHLADYDELLVTSRIWTEPPQIEQCLADITEQIELVIQKYLRNEYESIGDYNADAEVPEPYRFVVVANFPANFTETSARRLASIAASGARCGVYTIVSVDTSQHMPSNFSLADLEKHATTLLLKDGVYTWSDPEFGKWPLTVEQPPSDEVFTQVIQRVGKAAKAAKRVEVPFDRVAPKEEEWWTGSTASEVLAPLGPAGAKKLQYMKLGKGTSQHALIAGKTGSGKSTLMHALITSLALNYSPNEIQFYLIDFKKGVEFKLYDHYKLPHARVIAIESEREFGLSVLEQLDRELKRRGDLFREFAVQDVAGFRQSGNGEPMPRILLIIDEFQEIFVEDDKIAQDASLILDRLVRQGRAFGMHVLLGSQTLGGSYSLPRATMGQMAVRIALQCNEADSSLILSEDNTAARLLTRPGEAIYNDANGMVAGNNPFQVVFLNDERRERYLGALRRLADRRTDIPALPRMVFDGNEAADPAGNAMLAELLGHGTVGGKSQTPPLAWLGDAIAIKDPTAAIFRRQGGANLLIVGQREDLGVSLLAMSIVSLAAAHDPHQGGGLGRAARFVVFEPAIAEEKPDILLANIAPSLPHETELVGRLGVGDAIQRLADEVRRRIDEQVLDGEAVYVIIRDLARFRELRRNEADFGYSSFGGEQKATPAQNLVALLKDGPPVGVHVLIWCDSLTNLQRTFERGTLKEFELRVLFQMSGSDSSQLVDSPAAVKLGPQRALFIHEETGTLEKFRPYAFPGGEWLAGVATAMRARPQGTPVERPVGTTSAATPKPAAAPGDDFGFTGTLGGGFGGDEFNFAKFLDDPPADGSPPDDAKQ